jgi:DNA-binding CsgD family transcriptional regulator
MRDTLTLLTLTADLHAAASEPQRWPAAWTALCQWIECSDVFGDGKALAKNNTTLLADITMRSVRIRQCAEAGGGQCGQGGQGGHVDESKRLSCLALIKHLDLALGNTQGVVRNNSPLAYLAALDVLPVAMMLCQPNLRLIHANRAGVDELERQRWLRTDGEMLVVFGATIQTCFSTVFSELATSESITPRMFSMLPINGNAADIGLRRLANGNSEALILVSLITHTAEHTEEQLASIGERRMLPPRQRELAGLLLAGHSLDSAAAKMGIMRTTARGHLKGLFRATGTRRQQDLLARLARDTHG